MKIISKFNLLLLVSILFTIVATAQTPTPAMLVGAWKLESLKPKFPDNVTAKQKAAGEKVIADDTEEFKKISFVFTKQGGLAVGKKQFTWAMDSDGKTVEVKKKNKVAIVATVLTLTDHKLIFSRPDEGMIVTYTLVR